MSFLMGNTSGVTVMDWSLWLRNESKSRPAEVRVVPPATSELDLLIEETQVMPASLRSGVAH